MSQLLQDCLRWRLSETWHRASACPGLGPSSSSHLTPWHRSHQGKGRELCACLLLLPVSFLEKACQDLLCHEINSWNSCCRGRNGTLLSIPASLWNPQALGLPSTQEKDLGWRRVGSRHHWPHRWKCASAECVPIKYL